ncbi:uncharacterized protein LOC128888665 [Hylaeus anthracinus]|uniref:uncharacterized protein LOC128888665 n=1 Tax=Hylaeus anthracinus TaxID=313031 RepID=UPI0023B8B78D|nr:uncharacterized protein LOC128888665 [Hylaeus anthracinus]
MGADGHFRVTLSLRREPAAGPVYCKEETSARFRQLKTVKLSCEATYRLDISFKPPQLLEGTSSPRAPFLMPAMGLQSVRHSRTAGNPY